jgi:hypothetical protein
VKKERMQEGHVKKERMQEDMLQGLVEEDAVRRWCGTVMGVGGISSHAEHDATHAQRHWQMAHRLHLMFGGIREDERHNERMRREQKERKGSYHAIDVWAEEEHG